MEFKLSNEREKRYNNTNKRGVVTSICYSFLLCKTKEIPSSIASLSNYTTSTEL